MRVGELRRFLMRCRLPSALHLGNQVDLWRVDFLPGSSGVRHSGNFIPYVLSIAVYAYLCRQPVRFGFSLCCSNWRMQNCANFCPIKPSAWARCWGERCSLRTAMLPARGWFEKVPNQTPAQRRAGWVGPSVASVLRISAGDGRLVPIRPKRVAPIRRIS